MSNETSSVAEPVGRPAGLPGTEPNAGLASHSPEKTMPSNQVRPNDAPGISKDTRRRVITASFIGNFVEWFDYAVYGYLAATIAGAFFPNQDKQTALLATFAVFAISFFVRPLGGFVWGQIGDKVGRRNALSLSILIMSAATFAIALIPGYNTIGIWAPVLLLVVRVVQGFSAAGEYAGASAFLVEYAPANRRGLYAAVVPASTAAGLLLGSLLAAVLSLVLSPEQMQDWGWRLPFLLAAPMGLIGRYIRTKLEDTPAFRALTDEDKAIKTPVAALFRNHWKSLLLAVGAVLLNAVGFYVILSYMPTYLTTELGFGATESFFATTIALLTYIGFIFLTGLASDRFGRKKVLHHRVRSVHPAHGAGLHAARYRQLPGHCAGPGPARRHADAQRWHAAQLPGRTVPDPGPLQRLRGQLQPLERSLRRHGPLRGNAADRHDTFKAGTGLVPDGSRRRFTGRGALRP